MNAGKQAKGCYCCHCVGHWIQEQSNKMALMADIRCVYISSTLAL